MMISRPWPHLFITMLFVLILGATLLILENFGRQGVNDSSQRDMIPIKIKLPLPAFTLIDQAGQPFGTEQLAGKIWIADFIFTRCAGPCPALTAAMAKIQTQLSLLNGGTDVGLVTISVDPEYDQPNVLAEYARSFNANPVQWRFLTGDHDTIWTLIRSGFMQSVEHNMQDSLTPIAHSPNFVLLDRHGRIRGLYLGIDQIAPDGTVTKNERDKLLRDLGMLIRDPTASL